jgi:flagellin-specific chaperone FliS
MARAKQITADKLERLGGQRLVQILEEHAGADAILRRKLALALSALDGSDKLAVALEKRIHTIGRSRSSLDWEKGRELAKEIDHLRSTVAGPLAERNARLAAERMWDLVGIADAVLTRIHGSAQAAVEVFEAAIEDLGRLWSGVAVQPATLARRIFTALEGDGGHLELDLVQAMAAPLGPGGRAELRRLVDDALAQVPEPGDELRDWRNAVERRRWTAVLAILADSEGDVEAYIDAARRGGVDVAQAADIALRLIEAGRPEEALVWLDKAEGSRVTDQDTAIDVRLTALEALGRKDEAQAQRWSNFTRSLRVDLLRDHLKRLPDFEDFEAERRAMALAAGHEDPHRALDFFVDWPDLAAAAALVRVRLGEFDGGDYGALNRAAAALASRYPAAATLLFRRMAEDILRRATASQYQYAAGYVRECTALSARLPDGEIEPHDAFLARLRRDHGRKYKFWHLLGELPSRGR